MPAKYSENGNWIGNAKGEEWYNEMLGFLEKYDNMTPIFDVKLLTAQNSSGVGAGFKKAGITLIIPPFKVILNGDWAGKGGWLAMWSDSKQAFQLLQPKIDWRIRIVGTTYRYNGSRWRFESGEFFSEYIILPTEVKGVELPSAYYSCKGAVFTKTNKIFICYDTSSSNQWFQIATVA
nr:MAG TPA: Protein of unknown function (DUF2793) [Caudoviricetes sp.]